MTHERYAQEDQELDDRRTRAVVATMVGRMVVGQVASCDDATRTAAVYLEGSTDASPGIEYGDHAPITGDLVLVWRGPLAGRRFITHIVGRDAGYVATGTLTTPKVAANATDATRTARASVVVESRLSYRPALLLARDDGAASHLLNPLVNASGQIIAVFDAFTEVLEGNRTRVTVTATATSVAGVPVTEWRWYLLRERADV